MVGSVGAEGVRRIIGIAGELAKVQPGGYRGTLDMTVDFWPDHHHVGKVIGFVLVTGRGEVLGRVGAC